MNHPEKLGVKAVLLDLDGTLLDTVPDLHAAANAMLQDMGRPPLPLEAIRQYVGKGINNLVKRLLTNSIAIEDETPPPAEALASFKKHYANENGKHTQVYPGVIAGLQALKAMGLPLALITNKSSDFTTPLLEQTKLSAYFDKVVCADQLPKIKPDPMPLVWACGYLKVSPSDTLFIGDSVNDALAGQAACCKVFLLPYGYNEGRNVHDLPCNAIVETIESAATQIYFAHH